MEIGLIVLNVIPPATVGLSVPVTVLGYDVLAVLFGMAAVLLLVRTTPAARRAARTIACDGDPAVVTVLRAADRDESSDRVAGKAGMR